MWNFFLCAVNVRATCLLVEIDYSTVKEILGSVVLFFLKSKFKTRHSASWFTDIGFTVSNMQTNRNFSGLSGRLGKTRRKDPKSCDCMQTFLLILFQKIL